MRLIEVSEKQLLALNAVVHGCNTNKRLVGASYMANIRFESPEMISYYEAIKTVDEMLSQPTIEAEPVRHGRWEHIGGDEWCCTNCGEVISTEGSWDKPTYKHCHERGAKMDGE